MTRRAKRITDKIKPVIDNTGKKCKSRTKHIVPRNLEKEIKVYNSLTAFKNSNK